MPIGGTRFDNIFKRLDVELDRMKRIGVNESMVNRFRGELLTYRPEDKEEIPPSAAKTSVPTTPYALAVNRLQGYKNGELTWEYFLKSWDECSTDDQQRLNELITEE